MPSDATAHAEVLLAAVAGPLGVLAPAWHSAQQPNALEHIALATICRSLAGSCGRPSWCPCSSPMHFSRVHLPPQQGNAAPNQSVARQPCTARSGICSNLAGSWQAWWCVCSCLHLAQQPNALEHQSHRPQSTIGGSLGSGDAVGPRFSVQLQHSGLLAGHMLVL